MDFKEGEKLVGESGEAYLVVSPLGAVRPGATPNVWSAVDAQNQQDVYILKGPGSDESTYRSWPKFQSEMVMHELFKESPHIRRQHDRIPPRRHSSQPPTLVLEPSECTLSKARSLRPLTDREIKTIMRGALIGLNEIHQEGLVYADLKPDNILVNGFRKDAESDAPNFVIGMLGDLGIVMEPAIGTVQPLAYRSPEVHFRNIITPAADIWSWGIMCCHLLESQVMHESSGLYEFLYFSSALEAEDAIRRAMYYDFNLDSIPFYKYANLPRGQLRTEDDTWTDRLLQKGLQQDSVDFLVWVLNPDPAKRPSALEIKGHEWLRIPDESAGTDSSKDGHPERDHPSSEAVETTRNEKDNPTERVEEVEQTSGVKRPYTRTESTQSQQEDAKVDGSQAEPSADRPNPESAEQSGRKKSGGLFNLGLLKRLRSNR